MFQNIIYKEQNYFYSHLLQILLNLNKMQPQKLPLTPSQIEYLKIGPKVCNSTIATKQLSEAIEFGNFTENEQGNHNASLSKIPKFTYGGFENTVRNFGVLLNRNFGTETTIHQMQKFGKIAKDMNKIMFDEKDKVLTDPKKLALNKKLREYSDTRTFIKSIYDFNGHKLFVILKSFSIFEAYSDKLYETLPIPFMKFFVTHVSSAKLAKAIETSMATEGTTVTVNYEKLAAKYQQILNNEEFYAEGNYIFERVGHQLKITPPILEFSHIESQSKQTCPISNKDILQIIESDFDNVDQIVKKYLDGDIFDSLNTSNQRYQEKQSEEYKHQPFQENSQIQKESLEKQQSQVQSKVEETSKPEQSGQIEEEQKNVEEQQKPKESEEQQKPKESEEQEKPEESREIVEQNKTEGQVKLQQEVEVEENVQGETPSQ